MAYETQSDVYVYYDETKFKVCGIDQLGHVLFFVPFHLKKVDEHEFFGNIETKTTNTKPFEILNNEIQKIRHKYNQDCKFHFSEISGNKWMAREAAHLQVLRLGVDSLKKRKCDILKTATFCKLAIIYYPASKDTRAYGGKEKKEKSLRYDETVLRMLLKGAVHFLYNKSNQVNILSIICDGTPHHRDLDEARIIHRLLGEFNLGVHQLRSYVSFTNQSCIVGQKSDHRAYQKNTLEYWHANMLQMADMLLGGISCCFKRAILQSTPPGKYKTRVRDKHGIIATDRKSVV